MTPMDFKRWRTSLGWNQAKAAEALGLSVKMVGLYERGYRYEENGRPVEIPKTVELACAALALGIHHYRPREE